MISSMSTNNEIIKSILYAMRQQEEIYLPNYYLPHLKEDNSSEKQQKNWRSAMVEWCYYISLELLELQNSDIVPITMNIFDRFMSIIIAKNDYNKGIYYYKLAVIGCFFISLKAHKEYEIIDVESFVYLIRLTTSYDYTKEQILNIELTILQTIQWRLNPPTPMSFVQHCFVPLMTMISSSYSKVLLFNNNKKTKKYNRIMMIIQQQVELGMKDNLLVGSYASYMALAAITNAITIITNQQKKKKKILLLKKIIKQILSDNNMCFEEYTFYRNYLWNLLAKHTGLIENIYNDNNNIGTQSEPITTTNTQQQQQQHLSKYDGDNNSNDKGDNDDDDDDNALTTDETMFSSSSSPRGTIIPDF